MKIKIIAAIVDTRQLTLYKPDGTAISIKQGDQRLRPILDKVTPLIISQGYAELDISDTNTITGFAEFEKQSGLVRFFKVAKEKLAGLFAPHVDEATVGKVPEAPAVGTPPAASEKQVPMTNPEFQTEIDRKQTAIDEIIAQAQPISDPDFNTNDLTQQGNIVEDDGTTDKQIEEIPTTHTVVAHVGGKIIPGMERIETHFARAAKLGSTTGVEIFLQRLASVIDQRSHSVEDLLKFLERADLPIAEDGSIIIYKVLRRRNDHYVDCHTTKVPQKIGSYVCMDISLVNRNRNAECSDGLHVARRGYISGFNGDVCTICKLAPEDVVTVPTYDANKMRVMGYHILAELPKELHSLLRSNRPITDNPIGKKLLADVLSGNHVERLEEVRITKPRGEGVIVTPITQQAPANAPVPAKTQVKPEAAEALQNPDQAKKAAPINPKEVAKTVAGLSRKEQAQKLFKTYKKNPTKKNKDKLIAYKKSVKLGWKALGIDESLIN